MSVAEIKRCSIEIGDWLWGAAQGSFNDKLSIGQIVLDATISAFPIAGEVTAARDVIAQLLRMCRSPKLWQEVMEWITLLLPLLAIVPLFGGLLKGIGKLLMRLGRSVDEDRKILEAIILLSNKLGHGNAVKFIKDLDFIKYQTKLIEGLNSVCQRLDSTLGVVSERLQSVLSKEVLAEFSDLRQSLGKLQEKGKEMVPQCLKELNSRLKKIQAQLYEGEWHGVQTGTKNTTREAEARLTEHNGPAPRPKSKGYTKNTIDDYHPQDGYPDLLKYATQDKKTGKWKSVSDIEAFSGPIRARKLVGPKTVYRIIKPGRNGKASAWWTETMPSDAQEWRESLAVLDKFNVNGFFIKYEIPAGRELKVWEGKAAEQLNEETAQFLGGGGIQLFISWPADLKSEIEKLPALSTGWGKTTKKYGYELATNAKNVATVDKLAANEYSSKVVATGTK